MGAAARIYMGRGTEQQSCVLQHGDGASEYRLLRAEDNKQNLQENLSDVNTGLCYIITLMCAVEVNIIFVSISYDMQAELMRGGTQH